MKKTQIKEIFRLILSTKAFCVTLAIVTALGITAYTGISFATSSLTESCDTYYDDNNFYDIQIGSVYGFNDEALKEIKDTEGVNQVETSFYTQELVTISDNDYVAEFYTSSGDLNTPRLVSGHLPQKDGECTVEQALLDRFGLRVGDTITLPYASDMLNVQKYTIVGSVDLVTVFATNDFYNRGTSELGDGQVTTKIMVAESAFTEDAIRQVCYITVTDRPARGLDEYDTYVESILDKVMPIVEKEGENEYNKLHSDYDEELAEAQEDYDEGEEEIADLTETISDAEKQLNDASKEIASKWNEIADAQNSLDEARSTLDTYEVQLKAGRDTLDGTSVQLSNYKTLLDSSRATLDSTASQLASTKAQLDAISSIINAGSGLIEKANTEYVSFESKVQSEAAALADTKSQLDAKQSELDTFSDALNAITDQESDEYKNTLAQYNTLQQEVNDLEDSYDTANSDYQKDLVAYNAAKQAYDSAKTQYASYLEAKNTYTASKQEYDAAERTYASKLAEYNAAYAAYLSGEAKYASSLSQFEAYKKEYEEKTEELNSSKQQLTDAEKELNTNREELDDAKEELKEGKEELTDAAKALEDAKEALKDMPLSEFFSSDINANPSYYYYSQVTHGTDTIVTTLCTLLMGIAVLVCFTTISRMVTEQHRIIGTQKAMGFLPSEIYGKYIVYVAICTIAGIVLGIACSYFIVEKLVYQIVYSSAFIIDEFTPIIDWKATGIIAALELIIMCLSAFMACHSMLKKSAIALLNDNIRENVTLKIRKKSRLPLRISMVLRNLRSNPQILLTTLVSVMGCTILMISVFTVYHGMAGISDRQFKELQHYQGTLTLNSEASDAELNEMKAYLSTQESVELLPVVEKLVSYRTEDSTQYATLIGIDPSTDASDFIEILDGKTQESLSVPEEGILICKKMAENYDIAAGDEFILLDSMGGEHKIVVAGIFDRNIGMALIMSPEYYFELFDTEEQICQYYVKGEEDAITSFVAKAKTYDAYCNYSDSAYYEAEMEYKVSAVNKVIVVVLVITALLSLFVLFNLAQMNIRKKEKDIVVMKVLGFPAERVNGYVFYEAMIMCTIGLVLGEIIGAPLGAYLSKAVEMANLQDIRGISISSCLLGGAINMAFYTITNLLSLSGVRKIKMTGSAREA